MQKEWKQKIPRKLFVHYWLWLQKKSTQKNGLTREQKMLEFKKLCKAEGIQVYSTMSETKAAFAERTIRSLKNILYRYMEDNGYKFIHKLTQFITALNSRRNCSIDLIPKNVKNSDFLSILYSKPLREFRKPKFKIGDKVRVSIYEIPYRAGYKPQFTKEVFETVAISSRKLPTYTINEQDESIAVNFIRKSWSKSFNNGFVYKRVGFKCICTTISRQYTELFHKLSTRATESGWSMGGCNFRNILPINVPKCCGGKIFLWHETSKVVGILLPGTWSLPFLYDISEAMNILIQERHNHSENCIKVKMSWRTQKVESYLANERSGLVFFGTDPGHIFGSNIGIEFGVMLRGKGPQKPEFAYDIVRIHSLMLYTDLMEYNIVGDIKAPLLRCFPSISKLKSGDIITTGQYMNYQTFSNLQIRPLIKNSFHSIHIDLKDTSGEEVPFVSVGITRHVLMFRKASNTHF